MKKHSYALVNRPAGIGAIPANIESYEVLPRPDPGMPHHDMARHGVLVTQRALTQDELRNFELAPIVDADMLNTISDKIDAAMGEYAEQYVEQSQEEPKTFVGAVLERLRSTGDGVRYSMSSADEEDLVRLVKERLQKRMDELQHSAIAGREAVQSTAAVDSASETFESWRAKGTKDFANWRPAAQVRALADIDAGDVLFNDSAQFDALNLCVVIYKKPERGIAYARLVSPENPLFGRNGLGIERTFAIHEYEFASTFGNRFLKAERNGLPEKVLPARPTFVTNEFGWCGDIQVFNDESGYYLGTFDEDGKSRMSKESYKDQIDALNAQATGLWTPVEEGLENAPARSVQTWLTEPQLLTRLNGDMKSFISACTTDELEELASMLLKVSGMEVKVNACLQQYLSSSDDRDSPQRRTAQQLCYEFLSYRASRSPSKHGAIDWEFGVRLRAWSEIRQEAGLPVDPRAQVIFDSLRSENALRPEALELAREYRDVEASVARQVEIQDGTQVGVTSSRQATARDNSPAP